MEQKLFIVLLGGKDRQDTIEAHNLFIGIGIDLPSLLPAMRNFWHAATHVDAYTILEQVDGYDIRIKGKTDLPEFPKLVVANIGYYKKGEFSEFHKLIPMVLNKGDKIVDRLKKDPDFFGGQELGEAARSHLDDRHDILHFDVDDVITVEDTLITHSIELVPSANKKENIFEIGYIKFTKLQTKEEENYSETQKLYEKRKREIAMLKRLLGEAQGELYKLRENCKHSNLKKAQSIKYIGKNYWITPCPDCKKEIEENEPSGITTDSKLDTPK